MATVTISTFYPIQSSSHTSSAISGKINGLDSWGIIAKPNSTSRGMQVKVNAKVVPKINGTKVDLKDETQRVKEDVTPSADIQKLYNQLPNWNLILTAIFLVAKKQWTLINQKPRRHDMLADEFNTGKIIQDGFVFRQNFLIRSYDIGADRTASIETLMNNLQETALNHMSKVGFLGDGFGCTAEMSRRNLIWVTTKIQVLVEHYPSWRDVVQVDSWIGTASRKNSVRRDCHVLDCRTGQTVMRATSVWVMMNTQTRRLCKIPEEVRAEVRPYFVELAATEDEDSRKLSNLNDDKPDYIKKGLTPQWSDLDINQHVNNVKYIGWILESTPMSILENHELIGMTLEYKRECGRDNVVESLTSVSTIETGFECEHLLRLECGAEIVRGRTEWRPKRAHGPGNMGLFPAVST